jgi:sigma-E factor negative regulatory protein RseB
VKLVALLAGLIVFTNAGAEQGSSSTTALTLLDKMGRALKTLNYHGNLVYMHDGLVESLKLIHKKDKSGEFQRLVHLNGGAREIIRTNDVVTCYMPDSQSVYVEKRRFNNHLLARLSKNFKEFTDYYGFFVEGKDRVAGRKATIIAIKPKDSYRYGYRFSVDNDNGLLLKSDLLAADGKLLEQLMFVDLTVVDMIPDEMLKPAVNGESYTWHNGRNAKQAPGQGTHGQWQIKHMPAGFTLKGRFKQKMPNQTKPVDYMVVSDGLASVSVYVEKVAEDNKGLMGESKMGAVNIYSSQLDDHHVTVVGEVPPQTVQMIAESISLQ